MTEEGMATVLGPIGTLLEQAYSYAGLGLQIFPVNPKDKTPLTSQHHATTDLDTIEAWWKQWPDALIGHRISPLHLILDVDPRHGGLDTWKALKAELPDPLFLTRVHYSGRLDGGGHIWFQRPADKVTITKLDTWAKQRGVGKEIPKSHRWTCGIDILRHEHRYTILPPSHHPETGRPYYWGEGRGLATEPAPMPQLLVDLIVQDETPSSVTNWSTPRLRDVDSVADWYSETTPWTALLPTHGWQLVGGDGNTDGSRWRHPQATSPISATIKHRCLFVYSPNTPFNVTYPDEPHGYTPFRAYAVLEHHGDLQAAGRAARELKGPDKPSPVLADLSDSDDPDESDELPCASARIDWPTLWARERIESDWLVEPLLARGRSHAIYSPAKTGKSLLMLEMAAARAVGAPVLDQAASDPVSVVYFDLEMAEEDLLERMEDFGYGPETVLDHLHYYLLPSLPPLDTPEGGKAVEQIVHHHRAGLVVIDTTSRVVAGKENDADTYRALYANTGVRFKRHGMTYARLDHAGKDLEKGQRGSSGKNDDVDIVWQLTATSDGLRARATHRRSGSWIPEQVFLNRQGSPLRHMVVSGGWPLGTKELAAQLDQLEVPLDFGRPKVRPILQKHHIEAGNDVLGAALRYRRTAPRTGPSESARTGNKDSSALSALTRADSAQDSPGQATAATADSSVPPIGGQLSQRNGTTPDQTWQQHHACRCGAEATDISGLCPGCLANPGQLPPRDPTLDF
jgi:hypothetical protein